MTCAELFASLAQLTCPCKRLHSLPSSGRRGVDLRSMDHERFIDASLYRCSAYHEILLKEAGIDVDMRYLTMEEQHSVSYHWMRGTRGLAHKQADRFRKERRNRLRKLDAVEDVFA